MKHLLVLALLVGCATDENPIDDPVYYDPTGVWAMTIQWIPGACNATGTDQQTIHVLKSGSQYLATTNSFYETTTGTVARDDVSATINLSIANRDVAKDGGSITGLVAIMATADAQRHITGAGSVALSGTASCSQSFTLTGTLQR